MAETLTPDLCIVGAGPGGLAAATAARALDASVVLVERHRLGGNGLHAGSVAAKALGTIARQAEMMRNGARLGIAAEDLRVHFGRIRDGIAEVIEKVAPEHSSERLTALGVQVLTEAASFADPRTLKAGETLVRARRFILATGGRPKLPAITGLDTVPYFTTDTIFTNLRRPAHLLVLGGDAVALEIAQAYRRLGSEVTLVHPGSMLADHDAELAEVVLRRLRDEGLIIRPETTISMVSGDESKISAELVEGEGDGAVKTTLEVSHLLIAAGRAPDLDGLDLENARIARSPEGDLVLKGGFRTGNRRVFAIGEAAGAMSAAAAMQGARRAVDAALLGQVRERAQPPARAVFTDPEIAEAGITEAEVRNSKAGFTVFRAAFAENHRALAEHTTYGVAKLVCDKRGTILGAGLVGPGAAELISLFALAIAQKLPVSALGSFVAPYPTLSGIVEQLVAESERSREPGPVLRRRMAVVRRLP